MDDKFQNNDLEQNEIEEQEKVDALEESVVEESKDTEESVLEQDVIEESKTKEQTDDFSQEQNSNPNHFQNQNVYNQNAYNQNAAYQGGNYYGAPDYRTTNHEMPNGGMTGRKNKKKSSGTGKKWVLCISMALVFGILASATFQASNYIVDRFYEKNKEIPSKTGGNGKLDKTEVSTSGNQKIDSDIADVVEEVMPSVVSITNMSVQQVQDFFGGIRQYESQSSGSGIIIAQNDEELLLVTNNHVIEGSTTLTVTFSDGESVEGHVKGTNADMDLAVVAVKLSAIKDSTMNEIKTATMGDSDALRVGESAIAIGNALGYGQSVTNGIISAKNRQLEGFKAPLIQTNAAINPGNSGGALLNAKGEVIGINTVKVNANAVEGMGYAIPISDVSEIINGLMTRETRSKVDEEKRGVIGIKGMDVDAQSAEVYNMPEGVFIKEVVKGGSADRAGIRKGSIITKFDGTPIDGMATLQSQLEYYKAGETIKLQIMVPSADGEYVEKTVTITLQKKS